MARKKSAARFVSSTLADDFELTRLNDSKILQARRKALGLPARTKNKRKSTK